MRDPTVNPKLTRLRRACDMCSMRKVKCGDTNIPCRPCRELGVDCTYERETKRRGPPNRHAEAAKAAKRARLELYSGSPVAAAAAGPSPGPGHPGLGFSGAAASCSAPGNPGIAKARSGSDGRRSGSRVSSAELPVAARATRRAAQTTTSTWPGPLTRNNASTAAGFTDGDPNIRPSPEVPDGLENRAPERQKRNGTMAHVSRA